MFFCRGGPHYHILLFLCIEPGVTPPSLWTSEETGLTEEEMQRLKGEIEDINSDLISASLSEAKCSEHTLEDPQSCSECESVRNLVSTFQTHHCTFTCKKRKKFIKIYGSQGLGLNEDASDDILTHVCRFHFPRFPVDRNILLSPISKSEDAKTRQRMKKDYEHIRAYLIRKTHFFESKEQEHVWNKFKKMTFEEFLQDLGMFEDIPAEKTETERKEIGRIRYLNALRVSITSNGQMFLFRNTEDVFINNFNPIILSLIKSNHDIQYVFNGHAVANYITAYMTKNESGMSRLLKHIDEEVGHSSHFEKLKKFGTVLDKNREESIQEAIYRANGLPMSRFSREVKHIQTSHPDMRAGLLKANWSELDDNESLFHMSIHQYYENRPEELEAICLADFVAEYEIRKHDSPRFLPLQNDHGFLQKRLRTAVLRYYLHYDDNEELTRGILILFFPFRNELQDIHSKNVMELFDENKDLIEENRKKYEKNINLVSLIRDIEKQQQGQETNDNDEQNVNDDGEVDVASFLDGETTSEKDLNDFVASMKAKASKEVERNSDNIIPTIESIREDINKLNAKQRLFFDDIVERIVAGSLSEQFCIFLAGQAGTGKSTLTNALINGVKYLQMESGDELEKPKLLIMAPTACAANLIKGKTIESCLGINPQERWNFVKPAPERQSQLKFLYEEVSLIICDEVNLNSVKAKLAILI